MKNLKRKTAELPSLQAIVDRFNNMSSLNSNQIKSALSKSIHAYDTHSAYSQRMNAIKMSLELLYGIVITVTPILPNKYPPFHFSFKVTVEQFSKETGFNFIAEIGGDYEKNYSNSFEALVVGIDEALIYLQK